MKTMKLTLLLLVVLSLMAGGCAQQPPASVKPELDMEYTLETAMQDGKMVFMGVGGEIDGIANPDLTARPGDKVRLILVNGDGMLHDLAIPDLNVAIAMVGSKGQTGEALFEASEAGSFAYYCTIAGHRQAGMEGKLVVREP